MMAELTQAADPNASARVIPGWAIKSKTLNKHKPILDSQQVVRSGNQDQHVEKASERSEYRELKE